MNQNSQENFSYRIATLADLENVWKKDIERNAGDERWVRWREEYISYNEKGQAKTFVALLDDGEVIAHVTLILSTQVKAVLNKLLLCDGKFVANYNAFRCDEKYRGQGHISKLVKLSTEWAAKNGIKTITIGVEATKPKNMSIYFHFGFIEFVMYEFDIDENELILYYKKDIK